MIYIPTIHTQQIYKSLSSKGFDVGKITLSEGSNKLEQYIKILEWEQITERNLIWSFDTLKEEYPQIKFRMRRVTIFWW